MVGLGVRWRVLSCSLRRRTAPVTLSSLYRPLWLCLFAWACATGGASPDAGPRPDIGSADECGDPGQLCCARTPRCDNTVCGAEGQCCAVVGVGDCTDDEECCGDLECVGGGCCVRAGEACGSAIDCCNNGLCLGGICFDEADLCGELRGRCCPGGACRAGLECEQGTCVPCGAEGDACCRAGDPCQGMAVCVEGTCRAPVACGGLDESCCEGDACAGSLVCSGGLCVEPRDLCDFAACESCAEAVGRGCGFCEDSGECVAGSETGPASGRCETWRFGAASCPRPDPCPALAACGSCAGEGRCGWCASTESCAQGTAAGPSTGSCPDWRWTTASCEPDSCGLNGACGPCTSDFSFVCGWCGTAARCRRGTSAGPLDESCPSADWAWLPDDC